MLVKVFHAKTRMNRISRKIDESRVVRVFQRLEGALATSSTQRNRFGNIINDLR